ncbi:MAG TPA: hypothetical protein VFZ16_12190 [Hyphomicrobiaceae bacterium]|nr:hypothetical protein [Hyphomicrobiaceae bacterium]
MTRPGDIRELISNVTAPLPPGRQRMHLRYGFNEVDGWWSIGLGPHRKELQRHHRLMGTEIVRIFVFDKPVPDPVKEWDLFAAYVQAVLDMGAVPMITFAKYHPPHDDERNLRTYLARCADVVWGCLEQWGGERVRDWYWCVWNEPNNYHVGGLLTFPQYRCIYEEVAYTVRRLMEPHLAGRKLRIGGPALCGFQTYWLDWISALVNEVDEQLISFVSWHHYGDWRPVVPAASVGFNLKGDPEAPLGAPYRAQLMAQTAQYEARARAVARIIGDRDILNVCGELNTVVHHNHDFVGGLNQNAFGAAYYTSAIIHLIRGGADLEMRWTATAHDDAYGVLTMEGKPTAACLAKQMLAQHVRFGDRVSFPSGPADSTDVDAIVAAGDDGRVSGIFVNTGPKPRVLAATEWAAELHACRDVLRLDKGTGEQIVCGPFDGTVRLDGYGVAVVSSAVSDAVPVSGRTLKDRRR